MSDNKNLPTSAAALVESLQQNPEAPVRVSVPGSLDTVVTGVRWDVHDSEWVLQTYPITKCHKEAATEDTPS